MTRKEHLRFCERCIKRELNMKIGLVCNLTGKHADFEKECENYELDTTVVETKNETEELDHEVAMSRLSEENIEKFKEEQNFSLGLMTSIITGTICAILWGIITVATGFQIGYMAIAIGAAVGFTNRFFGKGIEQVYGIYGAIIAILSCFLGNILSIIGFAAHGADLGYFEAFILIDFGKLFDIVGDTFGFVDVFFFAIAGIEGYKLSFRAFSEKEIFELNEEES
ncbi:hypothetical protein [Aureivirga marina]|uniref:hypothetical protein n=1 Tax=Aureivirga marina TaxID=1182451 RepID=UPI0018CAA2B0|nr:hypothetical protein [Aureivirga marina]